MLTVSTWYPPIAGRRPKSIGLNYLFAIFIISPCWTAHHDGDLASSTTSTQTYYDPTTEAPFDDAYAQWRLVQALIRTCSLPGLSDSCFQTDL
jgi:hypothetical protein